MFAFQTLTQSVAMKTVSVKGIVKVACIGKLELSVINFLMIKI